MNVTFHVLAAFATGTALAARMPERANSARVPKLSQSLRDAPWLAAGLVANVLLHGAMDLSPHNYPVPWRLDIVAGVVLMAAVLAAVRPRYIAIFAATFLGGLLPDLVDQGPGLLNQALGLHLPERELFGFHTLRYTVSAYVGHPALFSALSHLLVVGGCAALLWLNRRPLVRDLLRHVPIGGKA